MFVSARKFLAPARRLEAHRLEAHRLEARHYKN
jgi:hypothetical protein